MSVLLCVRGGLEIEIIEHFATLDPPIEIGRRCADAVELLATAAAGLGNVAVVSEMDLVTAAELHRCGVRIIGITGTGGVDGHRGCDGVASPFAPDIAACIRQVSAEPVREPAPVVRMEKGQHGKVIAVWGSGGSPGRSTIARDLAREFSLSGRTILVDGDVYQPSLAQALAMEQETSAIVASFRALNAGERGYQLVERACAHIAGFHFLAGLNVGTRWRELPESVAEEFWPVLRQGWDWSVVDCAAPAERDDYSFQGQRDGVTLSLLSHADAVLLVGQPGAVGIRRLLDHYDRACELGIDVRIVINRARGDRTEITNLVKARGIAEILWVREDPGHMHAAVESGKLLAEVALASGVLRDVQAIATSLGATGVRERDGEGIRRRRKISLKKRRHAISSMGRVEGQTGAPAGVGKPATLELARSLGRPDSSRGGGKHRRIG